MKKDEFIIELESLSKPGEWVLDAKGRIRSCVGYCPVSWLAAMRGVHPCPGDPDCLEFVATPATRLGLDHNDAWLVAAASDCPHDERPEVQEVRRRLLRACKLAA